MLSALVAYAEPPYRVLLCGFFVNQYENVFPCVAFVLCINMVSESAFEDINGFVLLVGKNLESCAAVCVVLYTVTMFSSCSYVEFLFSESVVPSRTVKMLS